MADELSDEAQVMITLGMSAFKYVSEKFLNGDIQIKTLLCIFQEKNTFLDLLKIGEQKYQFTHFAISLLASPFFSLWFFCFLLLKPVCSSLFSVNVFVLEFQLPEYILNYLFTYGFIVKLIITLMGKKYILKNLFPLQLY